MSATLPNQVWPPLSKPELGEVKGWAYPCAITETAGGPRAWFHDRNVPGWFPCHGPTKWLVFAAWAEHERKRADAERRVRKARDALYKAVDSNQECDVPFAVACAESEAAAEALMALGETP